MNLSENQQIVNALTQILEYYDYLEYDEDHSKGTDQLCIKVSDPNVNCGLGVIMHICGQLGENFTCEPNEPTKFYIRMMDHDDYANRQVIPSQNEELGPEPDSAIAYYYRGLVKHYMGQYESAITDYKKALKCAPDSRENVHVSIWIGSAKEKKLDSDRNQFYWKYHNTFLEREAKRAEVLKRRDTPEWKEKRAKVLKRDGMLCVCGGRATEVHHKTYKNLGSEPLSDLVALCGFCYRGIHSGEKIKLWQGSNPMTNKEYREKYLESPHWKEKRKSVLDRDGYLCVCGEHAIYVHHKIYENLGSEPLSDLVALCRNCHDGYHGRLPARSKSFWHMRG